MCLLSSSCVRIFAMDSLKDLNDLQPTSKDGKTLIPVLVKLFENFEKKFEGMLFEMKEELKSSLDQQKSKVSDLEREVKVLKDKVKKMESNIDDADAYERRDTVILAGPAVPATSTSENPANLVVDIVKRELKLNISTNEISTVHRLGPRPNTQAPDNRSLIVKFCRRDTKKQLFSASKSQAKPVRLFVNESLTPPRRKIFNTLRSIRRQHPDLVRGVSTFDGKVFAYTENHSAPQTASARTKDLRHLVNDYESLRTFCDDHIKKPIGTFLDEWQF